MLGRFFLLWLLTRNCIIAKVDVTDVSFVRAYYAERGVGQVVAFACWNSTDEARLFQSIAALDTRLTLMPVAGDRVAADNNNMREMLKVNYYKLGVFLDLDCSGSENVLRQFSSSQLPFNESYFWLLRMTDYNSGLLPLDLLDSLPLSINAEMTLAVRNQSSPTAYELYDVYNPSYRHGGKLNVTRMGDWSEYGGGGIRNQLTQYKYTRRGDLRGMYINYSIAVNFLPADLDLHTYLTHPIDRHLDTMHRLNYALNLQLRDYYNFTMNLMRGSTWGYLINGTWNGIVGDMVNGIVDVSATPFMYKRERLDAVHYTVQGFVAEAQILFRHPKRQEMKNTFVEPFTMQVWYLTAVVGLLNWLLLYVTIKLEARFIGRTKNSPLFVQPESETFLITSAAICQQGLSDTPRIYSGRIVFVFLFLWAMLLYQFYSASIVGSLLSKKPRFIRTLKDLTESSLEVGIEEMPYNVDVFRKSTDKTVIEFYERKVALSKRRKKLPYYTAEEGLRRVQRGDFAFQVDLATAYKIITDTFNVEEICDLHGINLFPAQYVSTCTAKQSPFRKMVTYGLRQIVEHGTPRRLYSVWNAKRPECPESYNSTPTPVTLGVFSPALIMIAAAISLSIFILLVEHIVMMYVASREADGVLPSIFKRKIDSRKESLESRRRRRMEDDAFDCETKDEFYE